jgi:hypothetical protein
VPGGGRDIDIESLVEEWVQVAFVDLGAEQPVLA